MNTSINVLGKFVAVIWRNGVPFLRARDVANAVGYKNGIATTGFDLIKHENRVYLSVKNLCDVLNHASGERREAALAAMNEIKAALESRAEPASNGEQKSATRWQGTLSQLMVAQLMDGHLNISERLFELGREIEQLSKWVSVIGELTQDTTVKTPDMFFGTDRGIQ